MPKVEDRNPYVILGVPYGADSRQANSAFAQASKLVKAGDSPWEQADLTWALEQIEHAEEKEEYIHFRLPANPTVVAPPLASLAEQYNANRKKGSQ